MPAEVPRLRKKFDDIVRPALMADLSATNLLAVPRILSVTVSMGVKNAHQDRKKLEEAVRVLEAVVGQKAKITKARVSVAGFRLREGQEVGCMATLRRRRMYEFLDRLISVALPRVRDFRGIKPNAFDGHGNYSLGLSECAVFPEIQSDKLQYTHGFNIAIVTNATSNGDAKLLLTRLGLPFQSSKGSKQGGA